MRFTNFPSMLLTKISPRNTNANSFPFGASFASVMPALIGRIFSIALRPSAPILTATFFGWPPGAIV